MWSVVRLSEPNRRPANGQRVHHDAKCTQASVSQSTCNIAGCMPSPTFRVTAVATL